VLQPGPRAEARVNTCDKMMCQRMHEEVFIVLEQQQNVWHFFRARLLFGMFKGLLHDFLLLFYFSLFGAAHIDGPRCGSQEENESS